MCGVGQLMRGRRAALHVDLDEGGPASGLGDPGDHLLPAAGVPTADHHVGTFDGQRAGDADADAVGGSGDESRAVLQSSTHEVSPP